MNGNLSMTRSYMGSKLLLQAKGGRTLRTGKDKSMLGLIVRLQATSAGKPFTAIFHRACELQGRVDFCFVRKAKCLIFERLTTMRTRKWVPASSSVCVYFSVSIERSIGLKRRPANSALPKFPLFVDSCDVSPKIPLVTELNKRCLKPAMAHDEKVPSKIDKSDSVSGDIARAKRFKSVHMCYNR